MSMLFGFVLIFILEMTEHIECQRDNPPTKVRVVSCGSTTAVLEWEPPTNGPLGWSGEEDGDVPVSLYVVKVYLLFDGKYGPSEQEYIYVPGNITRVEIDLNQWDEAEFEFSVYAQYGYAGHSKAIGPVCSTLEPAPKNVQMTCEKTSAVIQWEHGSSDVVEYIIYDTLGAHGGPGDNEIKRVSGTTTSIVLDLYPGIHYHGFMIRARTKNGESKRIWTDDCETTPDVPYSHPDGVCAEARGRDQLVIVWQPIDYTELNGRDFQYTVNFKYEGEFVGSNIVYDPFGAWDQPEVVIEGLEYGAPYEVSVESSNALGTAPIAPEWKLVHVGMGGCER